MFVADIYALHCAKPFIEPPNNSNQIKAVSLPSLK